MYYDIKPNSGINNFPKHVSKLKYTECISNTEYTLLSALFSSKYEDGYLIPDYDYIILK